MEAQNDDVLEDVEQGPQDETDENDKERPLDQPSKKSVSFRDDDDCIAAADEINNSVLTRRDKMEVMRDKPMDPRHHALKRDVSTRKAMGHSSRRKQNLMKALAAPVNALLPHIREEEETAEADDSAHARCHNTRHLMETAAAQGSERSIPRQYNLRADKSPQTAVAKFFRYLGVQQEHDDVNGMTRLLLCGVSFDQLVIDYLHWCFRSSFVAVFLSAFAAFLALTMGFALVIWIIGTYRPVCIGGVDFEHNYFTDAFILSWTTFSTVGYGLIYSGTSADTPDISKCTGLTIVVTLEAFVGVLFASFCLAIIFSKVGRAQSFANVAFSDPILVRYGTGLMSEEDEERDEGSSEIAEERVEGDELLPCPIMEIQIVNMLNAVPSGQIMDATINLVASIDAEQAKESARDKNKKRRKKKGKKAGRKQNNRTVQNSNYLGENGEHSEEMLDKMAELSSSIHLESTREDSVHPQQRSFEEDQTGHLFAQRVFQRLEVETQDHPLFQRTWTIRHALDESSPLLKPQFRDMITVCGGLWPKELCTAEGIRFAIAFDQILVSFNGTSMADANTVYANRVYSYDALNIGYRFVNMVYKGKHGNVLVDHRLINDVTEQVGGGGEEFDEDRPKRTGAIRGLAKQWAL